MTYVVNGEEFSTKAKATSALFKAAERGEAATLTKVEDGEEAAMENEGGSPLAGGLPVVP